MFDLCGELWHNVYNNTNKENKMFLNGFTKESVMAVIKKKSLGYPAKDGTNCMYRAENGNCCLVGAFIPDEVYDSKMETKSAYNVINEFDLHEYMPFNIDIMGELQDWHDSESLTQVYEQWFKNIEEKINRLTA